MNKVDIYVNDFRLDLFDDEEITINLSVQNVQDISKTFTDFTQSFTIPASPRNNEILQHYYNANITGSVITTETGGNPVWNSIGITWNTWNTAWNAGASSTSVVNTFDGRFRQPAIIEINSIPFRSGVIEVEGVQLKGTEPYSYTLTFYGELVTLSDLFGEDYLYDLDLSEYDHPYTDADIYDRLTTSTYAPLFYPLMSPVKNWYYQSGTGSGANNENNIAHHTGGAGRRGIRYFELKPALKATAVLGAIEAKYGINFTGSFLSTTPFEDLSLWLHRREGYMYQNQPNAITYEKVNFQTKTGTYFDLANDTFDLTANGTYSFSFFLNSLNVEANVALYVNGAFRSSTVIPTSLVGTTVFLGQIAGNAGDRVSLRIKPNQNSTALTYRITFWEALLGISTSLGTASMSATATLATTVRVSELMPEIKVKDFIAGILKMYNMVVVPAGGINYLLQPLDDWYAAGATNDLQDYIDITEYDVNRPSLYREIEFKYQDTEQILGFTYQQTNNVGFGDLRSFFTFDGDEFIVELPFECPLFERLTDLHTSTLTNVLVYKSITSDTNEDGTFNPYLGAPILFYGYFDDYDVSANPLTFVNADGSHERVDIAWYANTSNRYSSATASYSICFGGDIDPYHLQTVNRSLYNTEWVDYITDLYNRKRRIYEVEAVLPLGKMATLEMNDTIVWNNAKYVINNVQLNLTTGRATFELLNVV
jgi:hypothetical protein